MSVLEKILEGNSLILYNDMTDKELLELKKYFGIADPGTLVDILDKELAENCEEVFRVAESRSISDFIGYTIAAHRCGNKYVLELTLFKGDEADKIVYTVAEDEADAIDTLRSMIDSVIEFINTYIDELRNERELKQLVSNMEREVELLENLKGMISLR